MSAAILQMLPKPRGKKPAADGRHVLRLFPYAFQWKTSLAHREWVYAVAFKGGVVKIGKTQNPRERLSQHWNKAKGEVLWLHLFALCDRVVAYATERAAPRALKGLAQQINGSEWFYGGEEKHQVIRAIREALEACRADWESREAMYARRRAREDAIDALTASGAIPKA